MPWGLKRFQQSHQLHFVTFSCYRRRANFVNDRRLALEQLPPLFDGRGGNGGDRIAMDGAAEGEDGYLPEGAGALEMKTPPKQSLDGAPEKVRVGQPPTHKSDPWISGNPCPALRPRRRQFLRTSACIRRTGRTRHAPSASFRREAIWHSSAPLILV